MLGDEMNDLTKILESEYTRCSSEKAPAQNERIFYPLRYEDLIKKLLREKRVTKEELAQFLTTKKATRERIKTKNFQK